MSASPARRLSLADVNAMDRAAFVAAFGGVYERSPWVAEAAWAEAPFAGRAALCEAMARAVRRAGRERQRALIAAHPDLAGKAAPAGGITDDSRREQASAGLDRCTPEEYARFHALNDAYKAKFGFPFVLAVRDSTKAAILEAFETRLENDAETEFARALAEIDRIARYRIDDLVEDGP